MSEKVADDISVINENPKKTFQWQTYTSQIPNQIHRLNKTLLKYL